MVVLNAFKRFRLEEYALFPLSIISITPFMFTPLALFQLKMLHIHVYYIVIVTVLCYVNYYIFCFCRSRRNAREMDIER